MRHAMKQRLVACVGVACLATMVGCAAESKPSPATEAPIPQFVESGFLSEYSRLQPVKPGALRRTYRNPDLDIAGYHKLLFDRITLWRDTEDTEPVESSDFQSVANDLYATLTKELGRTFELVSEPGPGVARIRIVLQDVDEPDDQLDVYVTNAQPVSLASDKPLPPGLLEFGRNAWVEGEILDSTNDAVIFAVVDLAADVVPHSAPMKTWHDLHAGFVAWADKMVRNLRAA